MNKKLSLTRSSRWLGGLALAAVLGGLLYWAYRPQPLLVEVATVELGSFEQVIEEDGRLRLQERYVIAAPTAAQLQRPLLKVGDSVRAGDVLARLQPLAPQMIDTRSREVLRQRVGSADAARQAARAQVQRAQTALEQARLEAERAQQLARDNFIAASARDQALLAQQAAQQALEQALAQQRAADFQWSEARAALSASESADSAPGGVDAAGLWSLRSPVDGQVVRLHLDSAAPVAAGQPLLEVGDTAALEAVIDVLSGDAQRITPGASVSLSTGAGIAPWAGRVRRVEPVAFTKVSALGIEEQRVNVLVDLDPATATATPAPPWGDGFRVDARISLSRQDSVLRVPSAALVRDGPGWRVLVLEAGHARARALTLHDRNADWAWIQTGLRTGELVLLYPGATIVDGQAVRTREAGGQR